MKKQTKHILAAAGVLLVGYWAYHRYMKKDKYTGPFLSADGDNGTVMSQNARPSKLNRSSIWNDRSELMSSHGLTTDGNPLPASAPPAMAIPNQVRPPRTLNGMGSMPRRRKMPTCDVIVDGKNRCNWNTMPAKFIVKQATSAQ